MDGTIRTDAPTNVDRVIRQLYEFGDFAARYQGAEVGELVTERPKTVIHTRVFSVHPQYMQDGRPDFTHTTETVTVNSGRAIKRLEDNWTYACVVQLDKKSYYVALRDDLPEGKTLKQFETALNASV